MFIIINYKNKIIKIAILIILFFLIVFFRKINLENREVSINSNDKVPIYSVDTNEKKVAITFDLNWGTDYTYKILDILDEYNIKATFFVMGKWAEDFPSLVKEINKRGHEIGNHSYNHEDFTAISKEEILKVLNLTDWTIYKIIGKKSDLFRFPAGKHNAYSVKIVCQSGKYCVQWNVDSIDWQEINGNQEYKRVISRAKEGSIILFHNNAKYTPENLTKIIRNLQNKGYKFVIISDLIYKNNYYLDNMGKQFIR